MRSMQQQHNENVWLFSDFLPILHKEHVKVKHENSLFNDAGNGLTPNLLSFSLCTYSSKLVVGQTQRY